MGVTDAMQNLRRRLDEIKRLRSELARIREGMPTAYTLRKMYEIVFEYDKRWEINDGDLDKGISWLRNLADARGDK
jgi:hypothetical protein